MTVLLVVNPNARMYRRDPRLLGRVYRTVRQRAEVRVTRDLDQLDALCRELATRPDETIVALSGGDGTLMAGVTALKRYFGDALPPIAPVPGGTVGTVARNWGIAGNPIQYLERLLGGVRRRRPRPSLAVTALHDGEPTSRLGFIFGTGLVAKFFQLYYEHGAHGYGGSAWLVAQIFAQSFAGGPLAHRVLEPMPCKLTVNGVELPQDAWSLVCAAVIRNLGIHMLLTHRAGEDPNRPHLVATPMPPRQLGPRAPLVLQGKPLGGPHDVDALVRDFDIHFPTTSPYVLDGELFEANNIAVRAGPQVPIVHAD